MYTTQTPMAEAFTRETARVRDTMTVPGTQNLRLNSSVKYHDQPFRLVLNGETNVENEVNVNLPWLNIARDSFMVGVHSVALDQQEQTETLGYFLDNEAVLDNMCEGDLTPSGRVLGEATLRFADRPIQVTEGPDAQTNRTGDIGAQMEQTATNSINPIVREAQGNFNFRWRIKATGDGPVSRALRLTLQFYPNPYYRQSY